jgi:DtxR family transcriptional regulator, Mn-dependent transcriptional regulator
LSKKLSMHSFTEENYLKAIFKLIEKGETEVSTNSIAEKMKTKAASVTDMIKKLADKRLINYQKYQGVTLTEQGRRVALTIIRKHRLWEMFLVEKLDFKWDEVHEIAEQLEHINSPELVERIDKFLNYPKFDPHGDPIPDANGKFTINKSSLLSELKVGEKGIITGVVDHSNAFLQYLDKTGIALGNEIKITEMIEYDKSISITINKKKNAHISNEVSKNILVSVKQLK